MKQNSSKVNPRSTMRAPDAGSKQRPKLRPKLRVEKGRIRTYLEDHNPDALMSFISQGQEFNSPINLYIAEILGAEFIAPLLEAVKETKSGDVIYQASGRDDFPDILFSVMPVWDTALSNEEKFLSRGYKNVINLAKEMNFKNLLMPALGMGKSSFPHKRVVRLSLSAIQSSMAAPIEDILIICAEDAMHDAYVERLT
jgi:O-acetyl-ADP-ribose deacetylase (regulator of RNase III)